VIVVRVGFIAKIPKKEIDLALKRLMEAI